MASDAAFVQYVCDQLARAGAVRAKKMFGEYAVYLDERVVMLVCDNQMFLKPTDAATALLQSPAYASPYPGAKPHLLVTDLLDDAELMSQVLRATADALPAPRPRRRPGK